MALICLHGFLGRGADWDLLREAGFDVVAPSLFAAPSTSLGAGSLDAVRPNSDDILLGYSMGARLVLHLMQTHRIAKAVLISAGIATPEPGRKELDETWACRFESSEPWESLMDAWNRQSVFGGRANPLTRNEADYDRKKLAAALREPRQLHLAGISVPTLWMAGEDDVKYRDAARRAADQLPNAEFWLCPGAAHRVPWEQPQRFIKRLREFV
ncbi:MAG TPA: alpha/beta fold hydrolase [Thermoanaerobaculia bacterium]|nr:alpha/beta fold hydrolase [Thermoanaerobaculia bacterium]